MGRAERQLRVLRGIVAPEGVDRDERAVLHGDRQLIVVVLGPLLGLVELAIELPDGDAALAVLGKEPQLSFAHSDRRTSQSVSSPLPSIGRLVQFREVAFGAARAGHRSAPASERIPAAQFETARPLTAPSGPAAGGGCSVPQGLPQDAVRVARDSTASPNDSPASSTLPCTAVLNRKLKRSTSGGNRSYRSAIARIVCGCSPAMRCASRMRSTMFSCAYFQGSRYPCSSSPDQPLVEERLVLLVLHIRAARRTRRTRGPCATGSSSVRGRRTSSTSRASPPASAGPSSG